MKKALYIFIGILCWSLGTTQANAQERPTIQRNQLWKNPDSYLPEQAFRMFNLISEAMDKFPPTIGESTERKLALYLMDAMLHETKYDDCDALFQFTDMRMEALMKALKLPVKKGMYIYKVYNDGFIVRTKSATLAFDIVRGQSKGKQLVADKYIEQIVNQCDVLFLSHNHGDHVDQLTVDLFTQAGKPVIAPSNIQKTNEGVTHLRSNERIDHEVTLKNGKKLQVAIFPGHQDKLENNLYVVTTPEKKVVAQIGDQSNSEDIKWIANLHREIPQPDALIINCWTSPLKELVNGFNPKLVISGHENEMGHTISHRESFWLSFQDLKTIGRDYVIMGWGEGFCCK